MAKKVKGIRGCKSRRAIARECERQGADVFEGSSHTRIKTEQGASGFSRGSRKMPNHIRASLIKQLIAIGIAVFIFGCFASQIVQEILGVDLSYLLK